MTKNARKKPRPTKPLDPAAKPLPKKSIGQWVTEWVKSLAAGFALFLVVRAFIVQTFVITSGSMEGALLIGDLLVLNKVAYGAPIPRTERRLPGYASPDVGDIGGFQGARRSRGSAA